MQDFPGKTLKWLDKIGLQLYHTLYKCDAIEIF
jgi:hypothetical protein